MTVMEIAKPLETEGSDLVIKIDALGELKDFADDPIIERTSAAKGACLQNYWAKYQLLLGKTAVKTALGLGTNRSFVMPQISLTNRVRGEKVLPDLNRLVAGYYVARADESIQIKDFEVTGRCIFETMEAAKPQGKAYAASAEAASPQHRAFKPAPELYPEFDFDRMRERASRLRDAPSDSAAISRLLSRPGRAAPQAE